MEKVYNLQIDSLDTETGMFCVSLVDAPAVETDFIKFEKQQPENLQFADEEKHIITGVALRADYPIYRYNRQYGDHYVKFTKETIKQLVEKYARYNLFNMVNLSHDPDAVCGQGVYMIESYFIDKARHIVPQEFENIEDGSWVVSYKINNIELWDKIKNGKFKGFSIEGMFFYNETDEEKDEFNEFVNKIYSDIKYE